MTTLYWAPHTCAIGIHLLLEEIGAPYRTTKLESVEDTQKPDFLAINPKGKVPTLARDDGSVLTEYGAIAGWLALQYPDAGLLPDDTEAQVRAQEMMDYAIGTLHGQAFGRIFMPAKFEPDDVLHGTLGLGAGTVKRQGHDMVEKGFAILAAELGSRDFASGERFGIADSALFYVERWAGSSGVALPPALAAHLARIEARPACRTVMAVWGEAST